MEFLGLHKKVNNTVPLVSVCVQVYNNEEFIEKCINSILSQKVDYHYEIIIGEDDSTDSTRDICKKLATENQDKIRLFLRREEDKIYHKGRKTSRYNYMSNLIAARGKYIALCDGDDYWCNKNKLEKQVLILEENKTLIASHHWQKNTVFQENRWNEVESPQEKGFGYQQKTIGNVCDIFNNNLRLKARTLMFRNIVDDSFFPDWFTKVSFADVSLSFLLGKHGEFHFTNEEMAVYRQTNFGLSKSGLKELGHKKFIIEHLKNYIEIWDYANMHYNYKYHKQATATIFDFYSVIIQNTPLNLNAYFGILKYDVSERKSPFYKNFSHTAWLTNIIFNLFIKKIKKKIQKN
jgi:glycosyltransferase involved in cell wall biosynthesis